MKEIKSTDLSDERIDDIEVGMSINDESFIMKYGKFDEHPDNEHYITERNYDQYWNKDIMMSVDRKTEEILQVSVLEGNDTPSTALGIKRGSAIDDVIAIYSEDYFTYEDKEQMIYIIELYRLQNNLQLSFVYFDDEVTGINIGYAFDKMKWTQK